MEGATSGIRMCLLVHGWHIFLSEDKQEHQHEVGVEFYIQKDTIESAGSGHGGLRYTLDRLWPILEAVHKFRHA